jgi:hypothetical protein
MLPLSVQTFMLALLFCYPQLFGSIEYVIHAGFVQKTSG